MLFKVYGDKSRFLRRFLDESHTQVAENVNESFNAEKKGINGRKSAASCYSLRLSI